MAFFDKSLFFTGGLRLNDHEDFQSKVVEEVSAAYISKRPARKFIRLSEPAIDTIPVCDLWWCSWSYRTNCHSGNPNLRPETSTSYDVGVTQPFLNNKLNMGITWFYIDFNNLIIFNDFAYQYQNANVAKTEGIEAKVEAKPCKYFSLTAAYTHADSEI